MKYYAVREGRTIGIFETWAECREQIYKYPGAAFKSFEDLQAAREYLNAEEQAPAFDAGTPHAFVDGSYSKAGNLYAWGGFIDDGAGHIHIIQGTGSRAEFMPDRNIAGEALGALAAIYKARRLGLRELVIYHDYKGVGEWAAGRWKANTALSQHYQSMVDIVSETIKLHFVHVAGHTGIEGNELADALAKEAAGVRIRKRDAEALRELRARAEPAAAE